MMQFFENFLQFVNRIPKYTICWLALIIALVIAALSFIIFIICTISAADIPDYEDWVSVSNCKEVWDSKTSTELSVVPIQHYPPRLVGWDRNVIITAKTSTRKETLAYVYVRQKKEVNGLRFPVEIPADNQTLKFRIDMGDENLTDLTKIQDAELYITDSDGNRASDKPAEFEVLSGGDFTPTISIFVTMIAIIVALLSLWAQPTPRIDKEKFKSQRKPAAPLKRFWSYMAVFTALLSLVMFLSQFSPHIEVTPCILPLYFVGMGLLISSINMVVLSVFESIVSIIVSIFVKGVYRRTTAFESYYKCAFAFLVFFALLLCISLIWLIANGFSWWKGWLYIPLVACVVIVIYEWKVKRYDNS